jgi:hypothetical protein
MKEIHRNKVKYIQQLPKTTLYKMANSINVKIIV